MLFESPHCPDLQGSLAEFYRISHHEIQTMRLQTEDLRFFRLPEQEPVCLDHAERKSLPAFGYRVDLVTQCDREPDIEDEMKKVVCPKSMCLPADAEG